MSEEPKPRRRFRLRYGLTTLFVVVTVVGVWLGWEASIAHRRNAILRRIEAQNGHAWEANDTKGPKLLRGPVVASTGKEPHGVGIRRFMGDKDIWFIELPANFSDAELAEAQRAFPDVFMWKLDEGVGQQH